MMCIKHFQTVHKSCWKIKIKRFFVIPLNPVIENRRAGRFYRISQIQVTINKHRISEIIYTRTFGAKLYFSAN